MRTMMLAILLTAALLSGCGETTTGPTTTEPSVAQTQPTTQPTDLPPVELGDPFLGEYAGPADRTLSHLWQAMVYPTGGNDYLVVLLRVRNRPSGDDADLQRFELSGRRVGSRVQFSGEWTEGNSTLHGLISDDQITLNIAPQPPSEGHVQEYTLSREVRRSPTEAAAPPAGAMVLLPMTEGEVDLRQTWRNPNWRTLPGGVIEVAGGDQRSLAELGSGTFHIEFMTPLEPDRTGQGRGNSGVYIQDRYEVQVLDSFGLVPGMGDCGAVYGIAPPSVNASLPPGQWQTYDIEFRAAAFGPDGQVAANPRITVRHNGVVIHDDLEISRATGGAAGQSHVGEAPLRLQDHGNKVRFRNIWFVPAE